jgi:hypothetical protein
MNIMPLLHQLGECTRCVMYTITTLIVIASYRMGTGSSFPGGKAAGA